MIIDHKNKVLIATPAKTGTASLETIVRGYTSDGCPDGVEIVYWPDGQKKPHTMVIPTHIDGIEHYKRYMVVRHPYDRLVSLYHWLKKPYSIPGEWPEKADDIRRIESFQEFVLWWVKMRLEYGYRNGVAKQQFGDPTFWMHPHCWMVTYTECASQFHPQSIIRLESFWDDLFKIRDDWGRIPHRHKAAEETSWKEWFTLRERKLVYNIFAKDMANFHYRLVGSK